MVQVHIELTCTLAANNVMSRKRSVFMMVSSTLVETSHETARQMVGLRLVSVVVFCQYTQFVLPHSSSSKVQKGRDLEAFGRHGSGTRKGGEKQV